MEEMSLQQRYAENLRSGLNTPEVDEKKLEENVGKINQVAEPEYIPPFEFEKDRRSFSWWSMINSIVLVLALGLSIYALYVVKTAEDPKAMFMEHKETMIAWIKENIEPSAEREMIEAWKEAHIYAIDKFFDTPIGVGEKRSLKTKITMTKDENGKLKLSMN